MGGMRVQAWCVRPVDDGKDTTRTSESIVSYSRDSIQARGHSLRQVKVSQ